MRVGLGYDVHKLVEGRDLIIGGVQIPYEKGLLGHSMRMCFSMRLWMPFSEQQRLRYWEAFSGYRPKI